MLMGIEKLKALHDGKLIALRYEKSGVIYLEMETVAAEKLSVVLAGIYLFAAQNFLEGNIVFEAKVLLPEDVSDDDVDYAAKLEGKDRSAEKLKQEIASRRLSLFLLEPSYGAEIACICSEITVT